MSWSVESLFKCDGKLHTGTWMRFLVEEATAAANVPVQICAAAAAGRDSEESSTT